MKQHDSYLLKPFRGTTLNRIRNILTGRADERTTIQGGYTTPDVDRTEGDVWEENGKKWTIRNGVQIRVRNMDPVRRQIVVPLFCRCGHPIHADVDKRMMVLYGHCLSCQQAEETRMKIEGTYDEWERQEIEKNVKAALNEFERDMIEFLKPSAQQTYMTHDGEAEVWN